MSSFYQLMMRKKEEIMYATIKGTLTQSPEGVFSGFTTSNYLKLNQAFNPLSSTFEICISFNANALTHGYLFTSQIGTTSATRYGIVLFVTSTSFIVRTGTSTTGFTTLQGNYDFQTNTDYKVRYGFDGSRRYIYLWENNQWTLLAEVQETTPTVNLTLSYLGKFDGHSGTQYVFDGSIDLPNSYIKLGSTKYNLQAVVGYTVVGSLTESPSGVFSGFSSANYLTLPTIYIGDYDKIKIKTKITTGATIENGNVIGDNSYYTNGIKISTEQITLTTSFGNYDILKSDVVLSANTEYEIVAEFDVVNKTMYLNVNGTIKTQQMQYYNTLRDIPYRIGYGYRNGTFNGSIDVANTEIYINNKLWFNGQEA